MSHQEPPETFICDFGDGVKATAKIDVPELRRNRGRPGYLEVAWEGARGDHHIARYRDWMLSVQQRAADLLSGSVVWVFSPNPKAPEWCALEPGKAWRRIQPPPG